MEPSPFWDATSRSATQEFPTILWNPCSQEPAIGPHPEPDQSSPQIQSYFSKIILILFSHLRLGLPSGLFPSGFPTKVL
jgi:hypothetical protein